MDPKVGRGSLAQVIRHCAENELCPQKQGSYRGTAGVHAGAVEAGSKRGTAAIRPERPGPRT